MHHISISSLIRRAIVWVSFIWMVMYGSLFPLRLGKWELWEYDRIHCQSRGVLLGAVSCTHIWCVWEQYRILGDSVRRGDAVIRAMMWVVARHMHRRGVCVCGVYSFKFLFCMIHTVVGLKWVFCRYTNHVPAQNASYVMRERCVPPHIPLSVNFCF